MRLCYRNKRNNSIYKRGMTMNETISKKELAEKLKRLIIERLEIEDVNAEDIPDDSPIFGEGLGLDSLSALDLVVLLEGEFGIKISNPAEAKEIFQTIDTLVTYILENGK